MFLRNLWYHAMPGTRLKRGTVVHRQLLGEPVLIGRKEDGAVFAMRDICPHRGVLLSKGRVYKPGDTVDGTPISDMQVECPYHGWRFHTDGRCASIPALTADRQVDVEKICIRSYPVQERQGLIWIYMSDKPLDGALAKGPEDPAFEAPEMPGVGERPPAMQFSMTFNSYIDHAVIGLIDPAHGPFVHRAWWWRTGKSMHEKAKHFAPTPRGFSMVAHKPSKNSFFYKLLGSDITTEITFQIPGIRTELIRLGNNAICSTTTVTPIDDAHTEVTHIFFSTLPWFSVAKPMLHALGRVFLNQDRKAIALQNEGLTFDPKLMLVGDADAQARWYQRMKKAWAEAAEAGIPFQNPVTDETTLRWRS